MAPRVLAEAPADRATRLIQRLAALGYTYAVDDTPGLAHYTVRLDLSGWRHEVAREISAAIADAYDSAAALAEEFAGGAEFAAVLRDHAARHRVPSR